MTATSLGGKDKAQNSLALFGEEINAVLFLVVEEYSLPKEETDFFGPYHFFIYLWEKQTPK